MSARFRLPAGKSYNVRATELERDRQHTQVVCNVLLLDNTVQAFKVNGAQCEVHRGLPHPSDKLHHTKKKHWKSTRFLM
ncbi:hypothetical protein CHARACLAT_022757 [Characodon lateralis]|uniref:Uncharacterized protein n=1 Tax=Characodon lateralis TaxID=208331 RepID=A0ABU7CZY6_9TELE|nr:hypothetical protein [Characodon lateralis]